MKSLDKWKSFQEEVIEWSKEIKDPQIKGEFVHYNIERIVEISKNSFAPDAKDIEKEKEFIIKNYGSHIKSLLPEIRDKKIDKILI